MQFSSRRVSRTFLSSSRTLSFFMQRMEKRMNKTRLMPLVLSKHSSKNWSFPCQGLNENFYIKRSFQNWLLKSKIFTLISMGPMVALLTFHCMRPPWSQPYNFTLSSSTWCHVMTKDIYRRLKNTTLVLSNQDLVSRLNHFRGPPPRTT